MAFQRAARTDDSGHGPMRRYWRFRRAAGSMLDGFRRERCSSNCARAAERVRTMAELRTKTADDLGRMCLIAIGGARAEPPYTHQSQQSNGGTPVQRHFPISDAPQETYQLFVFGDSLAAGLFSGMSRMAEGDLRIAIDGRFKDDSGLARPEFYDWAAALPKIQERGRSISRSFCSAATTARTFAPSPGQFSFPRQSGRAPMRSASTTSSGF